MSPASLPMLRRLLPAVLLAVVLVACSGDVTTAPSSSPRLTRRLLRGAELDAVHYVQCPNTTSELDALGIVSASGGEVAGEQATVEVPIAAVDGMTGITVEVPASPYLEVAFRANGGEHYTFDRPITVTIDYSRCGDDAIRSHAALRVVYVDEETKSPLEDMGGVVDSVARTVTFQTGHFSSYVIAD